jgi:hypothetical protein
MGFNLREGLLESAELLLVPLDLLDIPSKGGEETRGCLLEERSARSEATSGKLFFM